MDLMHFKIKIALILFLIISASLLSSSSAGRVVSKFSKEVDATNEEEVSREESYEEEGGSIHERLLRANTKDYGRYDPAPALVRPPFKLIPN